MKDLKIVVFGILILNIIDGGFKNLSPLGIVKILLIALCLILIYRKEKNE